LRRVVGEVNLDHEERLLSARVDPDEVLDAVEHDLRAAQLRLSDLVEQRLAEIGDRLTDRLEGDGASGGEHPEDDLDGAARPRRSLTARRDGSLRLRVAAAVASAGGGTVMMGMSVMHTGAGGDALRSGLMGVS